MAEKRMDDVRDRVSRRLRVICGESERMTLTARDEWDRKRSKRVFDQLARKQAEVRTDEALNHLIFDCITTFYNSKRFHSSLGNLSPRDFDASLN